MRPIYQNECSCGRYKTASDFNSKQIAIIAAEMHTMLNGEHAVTTRSNAGEVVNVTGRYRTQPRRPENGQISSIVEWF